jgi:arginyl-tRNA synthetase
MKEIIIGILKEALEKQGVEITEEEIIKNLSSPPTTSMGDYAFPCFFLEERTRIDPPHLAIELRDKIKELPKEISSVQTVGPYLNFFLNRKLFANSLLKEILLKKDKYGKILSKEKSSSMVEFASPNTNKPLHIGHLRNMSIGESVSRILEFGGEKVIRACLNNDRGIHICKSMAAYKLYGKNKNPPKSTKSDHFVGYYYSLFSQRSPKNKKLELEAHHLLQKWEEGDKETLSLWKKMNDWAFRGLKETYKKFGVKFDEEYYESKIYEKGKEIIMDGLEKGIFSKNKEGATLIDLNKEGLGEKILLRLDGTSVYMTQDLYLAKLKFEKFKLNKSIYVVGNEQDYHFRVLFLILEKLGFSHEGLKHLSYGMVSLPTGKIKSRESTKGLSADEIIEKIQKLVKKELSSRGKLSKKELENRSLKIALAAIKYFLLKVDSKKNMVFNPKEAISFEGDTGPYLQYTYARANSILKKTKNLKRTTLPKNLHEKEEELIKKLSEFKKIFEKAYLELNPSLIANYVYQLAQIFNEFYHICPVMKSKNEEFRISLVEATKQIIGNSLTLLGIETLEKM